MHQMMQLYYFNLVFIVLGWWLKFFVVLVVVYCQGVQLRARSIVLKFYVRVCSWGLDLQFYSTNIVNKEMCP
jgi:hypothetical protein